MDFLWLSYAKNRPEVLVMWVFVSGFVDWADFSRFFGISLVK